MKLNILGVAALILLFRFQASALDVKAPPVNSQAIAPASGCFGPSCTLNANSVLTSSGSLVVQSTTSTTGHKVLDVRNYSGSSLLNVTQGGNGVMAGSLTAGTVISTGSVIGVTGVYTNSASTPLFTNGFSCDGVAQSYNGCLGIGDTQAYRGAISYDAASRGVGALNVQNTWGNDAAEINFVLNGYSPASPLMRLRSVGGMTISGLATAGTLISTGSLVVAGSTFTVTSQGIVSAPSQPYVSVAKSAQWVNNAEWQTMFFNAPSAGDDPQGMYNAASSGTFTVPANGAGRYMFGCGMNFTLSANTARIQFLLNGSPITTNPSAYIAVPSSLAIYPQSTMTQTMTAGQTIQCQLYQDSGGSISVPATGYFWMVKMW